MKIKIAFSTLVMLLSMVAPMTFAQEPPTGSPIGSDTEPVMPSRLYECEWGDLIINPVPVEPPMGNPDESVSSPPMGGAEGSVGSGVVSSDGNSGMVEGGQGGSEPSIGQGESVNPVVVTADGSISNDDNIEVREPATLIMTITADDKIALDDNPCQAAADFLEADATPDLVVEDVQALVLESFPPQVVLQVTGYSPDGCIVPIRIIRQIEDNTLSIRLSRNLLIDAACPMMIMPFEQSISLGTMEIGDYKVKVNDFEFDLSL